MYLDDLIAWSPPNADEIELAPWRPRALDHAHWPPDYKRVFAWRTKQLTKLRSSADMLRGARIYYSKPEHAAEFIQDWMDTYDPRKATVKWMPFVFFNRQLDFIDWLNQCVADNESGLCEKSRDCGATWLCVAWAVWAWLFIPGFSIGFGSRKQEYVDKRGDPDSIFEKIRLLLRRLPKEFLPAGFDMKPGGMHSKEMLIVNPENGSIISGEVGDNIGRGGRKSIYFKDESAHYEHPDLIEAALGDNTNVQIDISSVAGFGNPFQRRRSAGQDWSRGKEFEPGRTRVFVFDWRDHPAKTPEWYAKRKAKAEREGQTANFAQEVDRDYSAAVEGIIIPLDWILAAVDADIKLAHWTDARGRPLDWLAGANMAAYDPADEGGDTNAVAARKGIVLNLCEEWGGLRDIGVSTRKAITILQPLQPIECQYDIVGVGAAVKTEYNNLTISEDGIQKPALDASKVTFVPWNAGDSVLDPEFTIIPDDPKSPTNKEYYGNLKAQAWGSIYTRFYKTYQAVTQAVAELAGGPRGVRYAIDELIVLDGALPNIRQICEELNQPTRGKNTRLQMIVNKKPDGAKSPNLADAVVMCYFPMPDEHPLPIFGNLG